MDFIPSTHQGDDNLAKLGSHKRPAIVRVQDRSRAEEIFQICAENNWEVIVGIEPDKEEAISDVEKLLNPSEPFVSDLLKPERNEPCPCGSGKKYKKCCFLL